MPEKRQPPSFGEKVTEGDTGVHIDHVNYVEEEEMSTPEEHPKEKEIKKLKKGP